MLTWIVLFLFGIIALRWVWKDSRRNAFIDSMMEADAKKRRVSEIASKILLKRQQIEDGLRAEGVVFNCLAIPEEELTKDLPKNTDIWEIAAALRELNIRRRTR